MFKKILIANRGEIAVRIIRTCQEMGVATVAVYSEADAKALHVRMADEAVLIGPPSPGESYLSVERILDAAMQTQSEAIHPGFGFLSENANFAEAVQRAGLTFIGPGIDAIRSMGAKTSAREAVQAAGVPVVPGYQDQDDDESLKKAAGSIGYPLLVKATAGGGGKGMRLVEAEEALSDALQSARNEAHNAFGDNRIYLEKYILEPRHIEFQIFGDNHGHVVHLFERECSVQRRHQKIIEETPAPHFDEALRQQMGQAAVAAAQAVGYANAGTVEFLVDADGGFYFLEMNTRLQVEHPITELVTGIDLVRLQLQVAAGEPLPFQQSDLSQRGHAIECRIYAEDATNGFLPDIGSIVYASEPGGPGVRIDAGITTGDEVSLHYDPMLAKLIVLGENRDAALHKMTRALKDYVILGVTTNLTFLQDVIAHPVFADGMVTTDFIDQHFSNWVPQANSNEDLILISAALTEIYAPQKNRAQTTDGQAIDGDLYSPWTHLGPFRQGMGDFKW